MKTILESLQTGCQPYVALRNLGLGNLDYQLKGMLERREIVRVLVHDRHWYGLPKPPLVDQPLPPEKSIPRLRRKYGAIDPDETERQCLNCGATKPIGKFSLNRGWRETRCYSCKHKGTTRYKLKLRAGLTRESVNA